MAITRWEPFQELERLDPLHWQPVRELERLQEQMNHLFDRFAPTGSKIMGLGYVPIAEMEETDTAILLKVEVPGMEATDIQIEATDDTVTIRGERKIETKTDDKSVVRSEFQYGKFERVMRLPAHIKNQEVTAEYKGGILSLILPKVEGEQKKSVTVNLTDLNSQS